MTSPRTDKLRRVAYCYDNTIELTDALNEAADYIDKLEADDWLPIENAPKDGSWVLGLFDDDLIMQMKWDNAGGGHSYHWCAFGKWTPMDPTHYKPMPAPPKIS